MQPVVWDGNGVIRFQENAVVRYLLDHGGLDLNKLHGMGHPAPPFPRSDWDQFDQLIGYSVSGCPLQRESAQDLANRRVEALLSDYPEDPAMVDKGEGT